MRTSVPTSNELRYTIEKQRRRRIIDVAWDLASETGDVNEVLEDWDPDPVEIERRFAKLKQKLAKFEHLLAGGGHKPRDGAAHTIPRTSTVAAQRARLVSRLAARMASDDVAVTLFRESWIPTAPLPATDAWAWLDQQMDEVRSIENRSPNYPEAWLRLRYWKPDGTLFEIDNPPIEPFHHLHLVCLHLIQRFGWPLEDAAVFLLTGDPPHIPAVRITTLRRDVSRERALERITLDVAPWVRPEEVSQLYAQAKMALGPWPAKSMADQTERLVLFVAELIGVRTRHPRISWRVLTEEWNARCETTGHPDWCYRASPGKDPNDAWRRLQSDFRRAERAVLKKRDV
jgi:hypothetical protein